MIYEPIKMALVIAALVGSVVAGRWILRGFRSDGTASASASERWFQAMAFGYLLLSTLGVILADLGQFRVGVLAGIIWAICAGLWLRGRRGGGGEQPQDSSGHDSGWFAFLLAAVLSIGLCAPVFDTRLEARDPGVYRLTAARIERTGGLAYEDQLVAEMTPAIRDVFFPLSALSTARSMGFYVDDRESGRVVPQFLPLAPVAMAIARAGAGPAATGYAALVAFFLSALGMFYFARRLGGNLAAVLATIWLGSNLANWWFTRYGAAEIFAQALILIACHALLIERQGSSVPQGVLAGWALGLVWVTKIELLLLVVPLGVLFLADALTGRLRTRSTRAFWTSIVALGALFFAHAWGWSRPYIRDVLLVPGTDLTTVTVLALAGLVVALALALWSSVSTAVPLATALALTRGERRAGRRLRGVLAGLVVGLAIYGTWFRAPGWDSENMRQLGWIVSPTGLVLGVAGVLYLLLAPRRQPGTGVVVALLLPVAALVLWHKQINPELLWAYRRYLPVVLPLTLLAAAVAIAASARHALERLRGSSGGVVARRERVLSGGALVLIAGAAVLTTAQVWSMSSRYFSFQDLHGSGALIRELAESIEPGALVLVEPRTARGLLRLEGALQHELGLDVLRIPKPELDFELIRHVLLTARRRGQSLYLLTSGYLVAAPWLNGRPLRELRLDTSRLEEPTTFGALPERAERVFINARLYRLQVAGELARLSGRLDIGGFDDLYLDGTTMHQVEVEDRGRTYRWTWPVGRVFLRGMEADSRRILIRMASGYPPEEGQQQVTVRLDGTALGTVTVGRGWKDYEFDVLPGWHPPADDMPVLEIVADPVWRPQELFGTTDPRTVGVAVDLIRWGH